MFIDFQWYTEKNSFVIFFHWWINCEKIQKLHKDTSKGNEHWYGTTAKASSQESQNYVDVSKVVRRRKRVGTIRTSCESVSFGYIELEMAEK